MVLTLAVAVCATVVVKDASAAGAQEKPPIQVRMEGKKFIPDHLTIKVGDTVEWVNEPNGHIHQVTTDPVQAVDTQNVQSPKGAKVFDSRDIKAGESYRHQFTVPGSYRYSCPPHELAGMVGEITVQP